MSQKNEYDRQTIFQREMKINYQICFAVTPAGGPKEVAEEATPPAPECAQSVKAQGLRTALRNNTPLEHLSPPFCEKTMKTNPKNPH